jgi:hypothetical protein
LGDIGWEIRVFRDRGAAEAWIREMVNEKYAIEDIAFT